MTRNSKIIELGLEEKVQELRAKGLGTRAIAQEISVLSGRPVSHMAVQNYLNYSAGVASQVASRKEIYRERIAEAQIDTVKQLQTLNSEMWWLFRQVQEDYDKNGVARATILDKILKQLEFQESLLSKIVISENKAERCIDYMEFSQKLGEHLRKLQAEGLITINQKVPDEYGTIQK